MYHNIDEQVSEFILDLYRTAQTVPMDEFKPATYKLLQKVIDFDSGMWIVRSNMIRHLTTEEIYLYRQTQAMIDNFLKYFSSTDIQQTEIELDPMVRMVLENPGKTNNYLDAFSSEEEYRSSNIYLKHLHKYEIEHTMATLIQNQQEQFHSFSVYRKNQDYPFTEQDRQIKNFLTPHWAQAFTLNVFSAFNQHQTNVLTVSAVSDIFGNILDAEQAFTNRLKEIKPQWVKDKITLDLKNRQYPDEVELDKDLVLHMDKIDGLVYLQMILQKNPLESLTNKEFGICQQIKKAHTDKQIAEKLNISPYTVNSHLSSIYKKLKINSRLALTALMNKID